jgi:hypothetical protein
MSETQTDYDTDTFPQVLMQRRASKNGTDIQLVEDRAGGKEVAVVCSEYADLLGTAAGVARKAKEMGYDPQKAVEALPELLKAAERALGATDRDGYQLPQYVQHELKDALASAEGSDDE